MVHPLNLERNVETFLTLLLLVARLLGNGALIDTGSADDDIDPFDMGDGYELDMSGGSGFSVWRQLAEYTEMAIDIVPVKRGYELEITRYN